MKSIEEFSTEYAQDKYLPVQTSQAVMAGANYVLGEIERIVKYYKDPHCIEFLKKVILQLKEK